MTNRTTIKTYKELSRFETFEERFGYLKLSGIVGRDTFGFDRVFNQKFYKSKEWLRIRDYIIVRDNGCDLGHPDYPLFKSNILIHHMNPITLDDINDATEFLLNPDYLICVSLATHNAIHYGTETERQPIFVERTKNDTCPWKK